VSEGLIHSMTPTTPLADGERVIHSFHPDRSAYRRDHAWLAAGAMALGMGILWAIGNPHVWTGAVGGLAAIAVRGFYGPQTRVVRLSEIKTVRGLGSAVQVITAAGDKHLIKYQADRAGVEARIRAAAGL
jgi:hypothetical protein